MPSRNPRLSSEEKNIWSDDSTTPNPAAATAEPAQQVSPASTSAGQFDMEGLMTDFPTARDLEKFVFDETGIVLNLKGRANRVKYQVAMDVLNGAAPDPAYLGNENPYVDKNDMVPVEELRDPPAADDRIPDRRTVQNSFHSRQIPHPDADFRSMGRKCDVTFRKYDNGMITYEILGPIDQRSHGEKIDKFGRMRPEIIKWIDPRSGEQIVQFENGTLTPMGKRLRALMQMKRVNKSSFWEVWIDREFVSTGQNVMANPWAIEE